MVDVKGGINIEFYIMSIPKKQQKLKPVSPDNREAQRKEQELEQEYEEVRLLKKQQSELTNEDLENCLPEPCLTVEVKLIEQLEECMSALLSVISIEGEAKIAAISPEPSNRNIKALTQQPISPAILTNYNSMRLNNIVTTTLQTEPQQPTVHQKSPSKPQNF